jgi:CelD/BcsL family acetyltransferase involved in cellulose biosynthesis
MAEAAASEGIDHIDLGKGAEPYKNDVKNGDLSVGEGWVDRRTLPAAVRRAQAELVWRARAAVAGSPVLRSVALSALNAFPRLREGCDGTC